MERIAITGATGMIGTVLAERLGERYQLRTLDRARRSGLLRRREDTRRVALTETAFSGCETVIDLAADPSSEIGWRGMLEGNIPATLGSFEGARRAGVRRVIFASSNHVTGLYEREEPYASICAGRYEGLEPAAIPKISSESPIRPDGPYAVGKAAGEAAGRWYAEEHGLSVICLRIGTVYRDDRPDGRYVFVGRAGDVIDTRTRKIVAFLPALKDTADFLEIDWSHGHPVAATSRYGVGYVTRLHA